MSTVTAMIYCQTAIINILIICWKILMPKLITILLVHYYWGGCIIRHRRKVVVFSFVNYIGIEQNSVLHLKSAVP